MNRPTITYTPESALRHPGRLLHAMMRELGAGLRIGLRLAKRDLDAQYRQTALGYLWAMLPVLINAGVWIVLNRAAVVQVATGGTPYWLFVVSGVAFWQTFVDALNGPLMQFQGNRTLLARVNFPKEALLASAGIQVLVTAAFRIAVVLVLCLGAGVKFSTSLPLLVLPILGLAIVGMVVGTILVPAGALFGDIGKLVLVLTPALMLLAPVVYPPQAVQGLLRTLLDWNPLTPLVALARDLVLGIPSAYWESVVTVMGSGVAALLVGWILYRVAVPIVVEKLDA